MGIESAVMTDSEGNVYPDFYEVASGCICCTVKDDLIITIEQIIQARPEISKIVIESTGLADPVPIIRTFWLDDALESPIVYNGTVTLIDASRFQSLKLSEDNPLLF